MDRKATLVITLFYLSAISLAINTPLALGQSTDKPRYQGTGSCSSSNCHGSVNPIKGARVLQNEYYTWSKHDSHSKAYTNLLKPEAQRMARHLGLGDPSKERLCLECHSTYVPDPAQRGDRYTVEDGVSCESCHGPAEKWLSSHSTSEATHSQNITNGLRDTVNPEKRATLCLSCHFGDESKRVTHGLYGAGHPRLRFELDTYGVLQPKHWIVDEDYKTRKENYIPLRVFLIGQATQAVSLAEMLKNAHTARSGLFPELSLFDCYSCHHSLSQQQWKNRLYAGEPGRLHVNLTPVILLQAGLMNTDPQLSNEIGTIVKSLYSGYQKDGAPEAVAQLTTILSQRVLPAIRHMPMDSSTSSNIVKSMVKFTSDYSPIKFEFAEQIGMGIQAALATSADTSKEEHNKLRKLFTTVENADTFKEDAFLTALSQFK